MYCLVNSYKAVVTQRNGTLVKSYNDTASTASPVTTKVTPSKETGSKDLFKPGSA